MSVFYLSLLPDTPKKGYWDYGILDFLFDGCPYEEVDSIPEEEFAIVVIPARSHFKKVKEVNRELSNVKNCMLFLMGDEEGSFPLEKIKHPNIKIWVQNPKPELSDEYSKLGCGYPPKITEARKLTNKSLDWFFAGQNTHERREQCIDKLTHMDNGCLLETKGFTEGLEQEIYYSTMSKSKVVPCPSGPETVDTFRLYEALELGCIPIADSQTPKEDWSGFWEWLFEGPAPFPIVSDYDSLPGYIEECAKQYPVLNNRIQAWWQRYKVNLVREIHKNISDLYFIPRPTPPVIVIPVSPIESHPEIDILMETIRSARYHFPQSEIIATFDGVREEQEDMRRSYEEHIRRALWEFRFIGRVSPYIFDEHLHQSGMMKQIIDKIDSRYLIYLEQDTPLVTDEPIDWDRLFEAILSGESNVIRLHHEGVIPEEHNSMMIGDPENGLLKTAQWSQRPHIASTAFYKRILSENFSDKSKCFIEDLLHGKLHEAYILHGEMGWNQWRVHIYHPDGGNIKRSYNLDGRAGLQKYDESQIW